MESMDRCYAHMFNIATEETALTLRHITPTHKHSALLVVHVVKYIQCTGGGGGGGDSLSCYDHCLLLRVYRLHDL